MNILPQSYKQLAIPFFKEVFEIIDKTMKSNNTPYYLIGATAVALELLNKGIKPSRGTKDIDFAVMLSSIKEYEKIVVELESNGFNKVKAPFTLYHPLFNVVIDLLPFGQIEENDTESFNERYSDLHVLGFKEVLKNTDQLQVEEIRVNTPPLPGLILFQGNRF